MKHLRILDYVDEVARARSIRKAAEHLNVTASAVNRRIADLEIELGAPLFERLPRGVHSRRRFSSITCKETAKSSAEVPIEGSCMRRDSCLQPGAGARFSPRVIADFRKALLVEFDVQVVDH